MKQVDIIIFDKKNNKYEHHIRKVKDLSELPKECQMTYPSQKGFFGGRKYYSFVEKDEQFEFKKTELTENISKEMAEKVDIAKKKLVDMLNEDRFKPITVVKTSKISAELLWIVQTSKSLTSSIKNLFSKVGGGISGKMLIFIVAIIVIGVIVYMIYTGGIKL